MKNLKSLLKQPLTWTLKKKKIILQSESETIIELNEDKHSKASFMLDDKKYIIRNEGFWNPKTIIEKEEKQYIAKKLILSKKLRNMKSKLQIVLLSSLVFININTIECFSQSYNLIQSFENGGTGTDSCWTGFNNTSVPTTNNFFTTTSIVQSGIYSGGMYSCCGGATTNDPTYYISPVLIDGAHTVHIYLQQSSFWNEDFEAGTVSDTLGTNFVTAYTKSIWPLTPAWELTSTVISTNALNNRIAFRVPPASLKTYYLDSIEIDNSGNSSNGCNYVFITSENDLEVNSSLATIYPNPFTNEIKISSSFNSNGEIILRDILGKELLRQKTYADETILNTDHLVKGLYFLCYYDGKADKIFKVIRQ